MKILAKTLDENPILNRHAIGKKLYQKQTVDIMLRMSGKEEKMDQLSACYFRDAQTKKVTDLKEQLKRVYGKFQNDLKKETSQAFVQKWELNERLLPFGLASLILRKLFVLKWFRSLLPDYFSPSVSLSNLGSFGAPPINPLVNDFLSSPFYVCAGSVVVYASQPSTENDEVSLPLAIACDHRVIDGAHYGLFTKQLQMSSDDFFRSNELGSKLGLAEKHL